MKVDRNWVWYIPAWGVVAGIFILSTFCAFPIQPEEITYFDKIEHGFAYAVLAVCFLLAFKKTNTYTRHRVIGLLTMAPLYGVAIEIIQFTFFPDRFFEWRDALANTLGVMFGYLLFKVLYRNG
jgi:VanZ family protein